MRNRLLLLVLALCLALLLHPPVLQEEPPPGPAVRIIPAPAERTAPEPEEAPEPPPEVRFRLWRISRRLGFKLYPWQRDFALGKTNFLDYPPGRGTGKTTAVMLRLLLMDRADDDEAACILACDPEWNPGACGRWNWYETEGVLMLRRLRAESPLPGGVQERSGAVRAGG